MWLPRRLEATDFRSSPRAYPTSMRGWLVCLRPFLARADSRGFFERTAGSRTE
jgi:hypothetical protein